MDPSLLHSFMRSQIRGDAIMRASHLLQPWLAAKQYSYAHLSVRLQRLESLPRSGMKQIIHTAFGLLHEGSELHICEETTVGGDLLPSCLLAPKGVLEVHTSEGDAVDRRDDY